MMAIEFSKKLQGRTLCNCDIYVYSYDGVTLHRRDRYEKNLIKYLVETPDTVEYNNEFEESVTHKLESDVTSNVPFPHGPSADSPPPKAIKDGSGAKASKRKELSDDDDDDEEETSSSESSEEEGEEGNNKGRHAKRQKHLEEENEDCRCIYINKCDPFVKYILYIYIYLFI